MKNKNGKDETAATVAEPTYDESAVPARGLGKFFGKIKSIKSGIHQISGVYDFLNDFKKNKHHVQRRLNMIFLCISIVFAVVAGLNFLFGGSYEKIGTGWDIAAYCVFGIYALTVVGIFIAEGCYRRNVTVKTTLTYNKVLGVFLRVVRLISLLMSILTFVITLLAEDVTGKALVMNIIVQVMAVFMFVFSLSSSISKTVKKFILWLKSPVYRRQFRFVATEWYDKINSDNKNDRAIRSVKKVKESRLGGIQKAIDEYLIRPLGKKYVNEIKPSDIAAVVETVPAEDKDDVEGTVKQIFGYAVELGMIAANPCDGINLTGNVEKKLKKTGAAKEEKQPRSFFGKRFGKNKEKDD